MNHNLVEQFREKLNSTNVSDYHGLNSPGLTCYLNSVLQVLFMTEDFREAIQRCCSEDSTTIDPHLGILFTGLEKSMAKTHHITRTLGITDIYKQRDASEYFEKILCLTSPEASMIFKGELNHKTTCLKCKARNDCRSFFWTLPLAVSFGQICSVEKGLKGFLKKEKVCEGNRMFCDRCNEKQDAEFECEITQNPEILTLLLKRFSFDHKHRCYVKLHCEVDVPQTLHMKSCTYDLYALVNHFGNIMGGHYTAQIKSFETGAWYQFDDRTVNVKPLFKAGKNSLRSYTAYLLMYRKVNRNPPKTEMGNQDAHCAHSDVKSEGRHDEAERGKAPVPHHQLKDDSCNGRKNLRHLNGDILNKSDDDTVWKKGPNTSEEQKKQTNQRAACVWSRKEMFPQIDSVANGDIYRTSSQKSNFANPEKHEEQKRHGPNRQQHARNSEEHHLNPRRTTMGHMRTHSEDRMQNHNQNEIVRETQSRISGRTGTSTEGKNSKQRRVTSDGCSSSCPHSQSLLALKEPAECNSPNLCRKSSNSKRNKEKELEDVVPADSGYKLEAAQTKQENTASVREKRDAKTSDGKVKKDAWK